MDDSIRFPFQTGEAIYHVGPLKVYCRPPTLISGVVVKVAAVRVSVRYGDGRQRAVDPERLVYRGFCGICQVPAVDRDGLLYCPRCCRPATPEPPPDTLIVRWYPQGYDRMARIARECIIACCSWSHALQRVEVHDQDALIAMLRQTGLYASWQRGDPMWKRIAFALQRCALPGDATGFLAAYREQADRIYEPLRRLHSRRRARARTGCQN